MKRNLSLKLVYRKMVSNISAVLTNIIFIITLTLIGCESSSSNDTSHRPKEVVYVNSSIDYKGKFRKGYVKYPVSSSKNTIVKNSKSKYYYETKGKYKKSKK